MINTEDYKKGFRDGFEYGKAKGSAAPDRDTSYWIVDKVNKHHYHYYCHHCGFKSRYKKSNYCPDCGRKMQKGVMKNE